MSLDLTPLGEAGAWLAGAKALAPLLEKILGASATEMGGIISDPIAEYRKNLATRPATRLVRIGSSAAKQIEASGCNPTLVPDYIAVPLLEKATLADDEGLQEMWASLLANAANADTARDISHVFPTMLSGLTPRQEEKIATLDNLVNLGIMRRDHEIPEEHYPRLAKLLLTEAAIKSTMRIEGDQIPRV